MAAVGSRGTRSRSSVSLQWLLRILTWPARTRSYGIIVTLSLTGLVLVALLHVWTRLEVIRIGYDLSQQTRLHQALLQHNQRLRLELATRKDPATVERIAREKLHMVPPDPSGIRVLRATTAPAATHEAQP